MYYVGSYGYRWRNAGTSAQRMAAKPTTTVFGKSAVSAVVNGTLLFVSRTIPGDPTGIKQWGTLASGCAVLLEEGVAFAKKRSIG